MRKLYNLVASPVDDGDQTATYRHNHFFCVCWTPIYVEFRERFLIELNCKNLRELFDTKRTNRHHETSEKSLSIFAFLFIDTQQSTAVSFVQRLRQVVQNLPNTRRKSATQPVDLADDPAEPTKPCKCLSQETRYVITYMPSALLDRISTTSCLSSSFHLRMFQSERTIESMYSTMSFFCPISS